MSRFTNALRRMSTIYYITLRETATPHSFYLLHFIITSVGHGELRSRNILEMEASAVNHPLLTLHAIPKVPSGDGPYVRAKYAQLVEKDLETAVIWFWKAINAGDRVGSALKDMAVVMKQLDRCEEAIEAVKSFRGLCSFQSQDSFDNVLLDLYKKCGKVDEQIVLLKQKLRKIYQGKVFNGRPTKTARSHGKKFQVSVQQETARILGSLGWAYMMKSNFITAEVIYRKAQMIDADGNKACNLAYCLIKQSRHDEARFFVEQVSSGRYPGSDEPKTRARLEELVSELDSVQPPCFMQNLPGPGLGLELDDDFLGELDGVMSEWGPPRSRRLPVFEAITPIRDQLAC
ncbi:PREDICTED: protein SULFUR DEFICIENCY-INDUCED 1-like isoform X1 [Ipomoea nil]|uniref:protein SULFUR DEFICIENCY-INDUCED 1-like isoform X1 n=2 Tax=Ipomoea nil TaxID=35883 RepID=UPI0009014306|nr:PREDICTED: protein SULFUR DEFICIENCY-INDUCED 1-like isoform X1 [Ipomoea nil]